MVTIQDVLQLNVSKIKPLSLQDSVKGIIDDYNQISSQSAKEVFEKEEAASIEKIYQMVVKVSPEALPAVPCQDDEKDKNTTKNSLKNGKSSKKVKSEKQDEKPKKKTSTKKDLDEVLQEIKQCRVKIKQYNEQKRKEEGEKPKPSPYTKIKGHFISLGNLIPEKLKNNLEVQKESNRLLKNTHRKLLEIYRMNAIRGKDDNQELKEKFDKIEEKLENK